MITRAEECLMREFMGRAGAYRDVLEHLDAMSKEELCDYLQHNIKFEEGRADFMRDYGIQEEDK